jgi:hypothetical protein
MAQPRSHDAITVANNRSRSTVWRSFEKVTWQTSKKGVKTAKCLHCDHAAFQLPNGTTNSLRRHLEVEHPEIYRETEAEQRQKRARTEVSRPW